MKKKVGSRRVRNLQQPYKFIYIDFETRSGIDLRKVGVVKYINDKDFDVTCFGFKIGKEPIKVALGKMSPKINLKYIATKKDLTELKKVLKSGRYKIVAHNAYFEYCVWNLYLHKHLKLPKIKFEDLICTQALAAFNGVFPLTLEWVAQKIAGIPYTKDKAGRYFMYQTCKKINGKFKETKELYKGLVKYNREDIKATYAVFKSLNFKDLPPKERKFFKAINETKFKGLKWDIKLTKKVLKIFECETNKANSELSRLTKGKIDKITQSVRLLQFFEGTGAVSLGQDALKSIKLNPNNYKLTPRHQLILQILENYKTSSISKLKTALAYNHKGRIHDFLFYHGAHTGRSVGAGVNPLNLPRPSKDYSVKEIKYIKKTSLKKLIKELENPIQTCKDLIRKCIQSTEGRFVIVDYNKIEPAILFWLAGEETGLKEIRNDEKIYELMASTCLGVPVEKISKDSIERHAGKEAILSCGYQVGADKFVARCEAVAGVVLSKEAAKRFIKAYRSKYRSVVFLWGEVERNIVNGMKKAAHEKKPYFLPLPSGRKLCYQELHFEEGQLISLNKGKKQKIYGGVIVENLCQAICRDLMVDDYLLLKNKGYNPVLDVYDEIIMDVPKEGLKEAKKEILNIFMRDRNKCYDGLPIGVDMSVKSRYTK